MGKTGRPRLGGEARTERILVCVEPKLRSGIEELAKESRRSLSDYCRYVLEQHVIVVKEEEATEEFTVDEAIEASEMEETEAPNLDKVFTDPGEDTSMLEPDLELPRCPDCGARFNVCNC